MRNHKLFRPFAKPYTDTFETEYPDAIWLPDSVTFSLLGNDETGTSRGVNFTYRASKSAEHFDGAKKNFNLANSVKRFDIRNDEWDSVYQANYPQLDGMLGLMRNLAKDRIAAGDLGKFFQDATLID